MIFYMKIKNFHKISFEGSALHCIVPLKISHHSQLWKVRFMFLIIQAVLFWDFIGIFILLAILKTAQFQIDYSFHVWRIEYDCSYKRSGLCFYTSIYILCLYELSAECLQIWVLVSSFHSLLNKTRLLRFQNTNEIH